MALITDCPTITVHAAKCIKVLIDSAAAISLIRYSTYQAMDGSFKTPIQATSTKLNTADGSPMTTLEITALHLRIVDFKFTHNFIICDRLSDIEILFGIDIKEKVSLSYAWDEEKNCYIQKDSRFLTYTRNCEQEATIGIEKPTLKIPPRHNGVIPIKIKGHTIKGHMTYFISESRFNKREGSKYQHHKWHTQHKGKTSVNILVSNYTNNHITFNKGEYVSNLEPTIEETSQAAESPKVPTMHSITTEGMTAEKVVPDTFKPPCHKLKENIEKQSSQNY